ncbi:MAG: prepilin peptidase, partial [Candidatus Falkowbacteria bacterium]|nr:prepilin peptidase [Candidatus Falkowbacteria bacterium]
KWIGGGDIRLGLLIGLALGWPKAVLAIFLAYFIGSIVALVLILNKKKQWSSQIPLGIFLSTATIITLFWGEEILKWYLGTMGF